MTEFRLEITSATVRVIGDVDLSSREAFDEAVLPLCAEAGQVVTVDLRDVTFMDSTGLNALITAHRLAEQHGSQISVCDLPPHVLKLFEVTGVGELLNVIPG